VELVKDGDQLDRSCEKRRHVRYSRGGDEYLTKNIRKKGNWIGHTLRRNCLIRHVTEGQIEGREDKKEDVSSYWIPLRKRKKTGS
jgi:hypothetical protein